MLTKILQILDKILSLEMSHLTKIQRLELDLRDVLQSERRNLRFKYICYVVKFPYFEFLTFIYSTKRDFNKRSPKKWLKRENDARFNKSSKLPSSKE